MKNFMSDTIITEKIKTSYYSFVDPLINMFIRLNAHPNMYTIWGMLLSIIAAVFAGMGRLRWAGLCLIFSGLFDSIDGTIARRSGRTSRFGALLDSTMDRYSEMFIFFGLAFYFIRDHAYLHSMALAVGLGGSLMVSYVRARAEGLGFECSVGLMQRPERTILLALGAITTKSFLIVAIWIIAVLSNITAVHRILYIYKKDRE